MSTLAKRHPALQALVEDLAGKRPTESVEVQGHRYTISVLKPEAYDWVASRNHVKNEMDWFMYGHKLQLACALVSVDDIPAEQLFVVDGDSPEAVLLRENEILLRQWRRDQMLLFLNDLDGSILGELLEKMDTMTRAYQKMLKEVKGF